MKKESLSGFSRDGLEAVISMQEESKARLAELYRRDFVGFLHEMPEVLDPHGIDDGQAVQRARKALEDYLKQSGADHEQVDNVSTLACEYGIETEEYGFRKGFTVAMRLCVQGLAGKVY